MNLTMLKSKIHRAVVTQCDLHYEGSITIDINLIEAAELLVHEQVDILNITNGERFTTYVLEGERGSGIVGINGAAARLVQNGDLVIICAYAAMDKAKAKTHTPAIVFVDEQNKIKSVVDKSGHKLKEVS
jgi:aspartate 1-decarboxylase